MPFCPRCGTQNFDTAEVCQQCGSALPRRPQSGPVSEPPAPYQNEPYQAPPPPPSYSQPPQPYQPVQPPSYGNQGYGGYQQQAGYAPQLNYASIGKRFGAALLDGLVFLGGALPGFILMFLGVGLAGATADSGGGAGVGLVFLGYLLIFIGYIAVFVYQVYLLGRDGATLGKRWMNVRVLDQYGQPLGFGKAIARELVKGILSNICIILILWPLWDQQKQALYDKMLNSNAYEG